MARYRLTREAVLDLAEIGRYTQRQWGIEQRRRYLTQLDQRFQELADAPTLGRSREDIRPGYRSFRIVRHVIFYRVSAVEIEVVRILHQSMDVHRQLGSAERSSD